MFVQLSLSSFLLELTMKHFSKHGTLASILFHIFQHVL